jgi:protein involved in temperature-dependent protein secretion
MTVWVSLGGSYVRGVGQHVFQVGKEEKALLEIRELAFDARPTGARDAPNG